MPPPPVRPSTVGRSTVSRSTVGRSTRLMMTATLASRLTGVARNIAFAGLTVGLVTDAYTVANNAPNLVYELVVGGVLSSTLVPLFVDLLSKRDAGDRQAADGISTIVTLSLVAVLMLSVALFVAAPLLIHGLLMHGQTAVKQRVGTTLLRMFAPQVAVYGCITIGTALLNARRRFGAPTAAPVLNNLVVTAVFLWARHIINGLAKTAQLGTGAPISDTARLALIDASSKAKLVLGLGTTAGVVVMGLALLPGLRDANLGLRIHWDVHHPAVRRLGALSGWTVGYVVANQVALLFVLNAAGRGSAGDWTSYTLANTTFFLLPHGVLAVSLITAMQPELASSFMDRARGRFRRQVVDGVRTVLMLLVPAAVGYVVLAHPIVSLVLGRTAGRTADALWPMAIGLPGFSIYLMFMSALKSMRDTRAAFEVNVIENAINIVAAAVLVGPFGLQGLALSFAIAYSVSAVIAGVVVARRTNGLEVARLLSTGTSVLAASVAMGMVVFGTSRLCEAVIFADGRPPGRSVGLLVEVLGSVGAGVTVYLFAGRLAGLNELTSLVAGLRRRLGRAAR